MTSILKNGAAVLPGAQPTANLPKNVPDDKIEAFENHLNTDLLITDQLPAADLPPGGQILLDIENLNHGAHAKKNITLNLPTSLGEQSVQQTTIINGQSSGTSPIRLAITDPKAPNASPEITAQSAPPNDTANAAQTTPIAPLPTSPETQIVAAQTTRHALAPSQIRSNPPSSGQALSASVASSSPNRPQSSAARIPLVSSPQQGGALGQLNETLHPASSSHIVAESLDLSEAAITQLGEKSSTPPSGGATLFGQTSPSAPSHQGAPISTANAAQPAPIITAPAGIVTLITERIGSGSADNSQIVVQLDPPELGRISIDFKFDGQGLQSVIVTGETPEAMRQLRLMHHELVNTLERQGLSSENLAYKEHGSNNPNSHDQTGVEQPAYGRLEREPSAEAAAADMHVRPIGARASDRVDIRI